MDVLLFFLVLKKFKFFFKFKFFMFLNYLNTEFLSAFGLGWDI